jgi:hypothetical protein
MLKVLLGVYVVGVGITAWLSYEITADAAEPSWLKRHARHALFALSWPVLMLTLGVVRLTLGLTVPPPIDPPEVKEDKR